MFDFIKSMFKKEQNRYDDDCYGCCCDPNIDNGIQLIDLDNDKSRTILRMDHVCCTSPFENFSVGGEYEVANITDNGGIVLRRVIDRVAVGVVPFDKFFDHFDKPEEFTGWTDWMPFVRTIDDHPFVVGSFRTNFKKVQVKLIDGTRGESSCNTKIDKFDFNIGLRIAYLRCEEKFWNKNLVAEEAELNEKYKDLYVGYKKHMDDVHSEMKIALDAVQSK